MGQHPRATQVKGEGGLFTLPPLGGEKTRRPKVSSSSKEEEEECRKIRIGFRLLFQNDRLSLSLSLSQLERRVKFAIKSKRFLGRKSALHRSTT